MRKKFEYAVTTLGKDGASPKDDLNALGASGWQLVAWDVDGRARRGRDGVMCVFMREVAASSPT